MKQIKFSAVLFVFSPEESEYVEACLKSISFADEMVVIDNGTDKRTLDIISKYTKNVFQTTSSSFADRHNFGKEKTNGEWIFFIDADERISNSLRDEMLKTINNPKDDAYQVDRINFFLGKKIRFGDRFPDLVTRLFKKDKLISWEGNIHESSKVDGSIGTLSSPLYHLTHRDIYSMMRKTIIYSDLEAKLRLAANHPPVVGWRLVRVFISEFVNRIVLYQGWREGTEGWIDGIFQAFSLFIVYARLWELQRAVPLEKTHQQIDQDILSGKI